MLVLYFSCINNRTTDTKIMSQEKLEGSLLNNFKLSLHKTEQYLSWKPTFSLWPLSFLKLHFNLTLPPKMLKQYCMVFSSFSLPILSSQQVLDWEIVTTPKSPLAFKHWVGVWWPDPTVNLKQWNHHSADEKGPARAFSWRLCHHKAEADSHLCHHGAWAVLTLVSQQWECGQGQF